MGRLRRTDFLPGDQVLVESPGQGPRHFTRAVVQPRGVEEQTVNGHTSRWIWVIGTGSTLTVRFPLQRVRFRVWRPRQPPEA